MNCSKVASFACLTALRTFFFHIWYDTWLVICNLWCTSYILPSYLQCYILLLVVMGNCKPSLKSIILELNSKTSEARADSAETEYKKAARGQFSKSGSIGMQGFENFGVLLRYSHTEVLLSEVITFHVAKQAFWPRRKPLQPAKPKSHVHRWDCRSSKLLHN
jgi:hypothetical protein